MRLLALADTHLFHQELVVPEGDVLVHAGDLCRVGSLRELAEAISWLKSLPHRHKLLVAGNHDWPFQLEPEDARSLCRKAGITYLEDSGVVLEGIRFWGSPWQPEFGDWAFNLPRGERLAQKWSLIPDDIDVLITHGPPQGLGDRSSTGGRQGCAELRARVVALHPPLHLFGHIHEDGGTWQQEGTLFANVTTWECERGVTVISLNTQDKRVSLVQSPPARRAPPQH